MTSMDYNQAAGLSTMLKSGHQHLEGVDGATLRNIEAAKGLSAMVSSSLGPNGMNKLVINHLDKMIVTSDCATIVKELEIEHPAARMVSLAAEAQDQECGDGTNLVVSLAGELLDLTEELLRMGLHTSEVIAGYRVAAERLSEELPRLVVDTVDVSVRADLERVVRPVLAAKQYGCEDVLAPLVVEACEAVRSSAKNNSILPEHVRVAKMLGGGLSQSYVVRGMVVMRGAETSSLVSLSECKVTVFGCGVEASATEAKGTVLMENAEDLKGYNKSEERKMEEIIKSIADSGTKLIVSGGTVSEMALHFMERYQLMCLKINSKWELRRLCTATNSTALVRLGPATADEMGYCDSVAVRDVAGRKITVLTNAQQPLTTIVLRAATSTVLQDSERAVDDGVRAAAQASRDGRVVPGAGATEANLAQSLRAFGDTRPGLDQYAVRALGRALELVPRTLAENAGMDKGVVMAKLVNEHSSSSGGGGSGESKSSCTMGVDIENGDGTGTRDVVNTDQPVLDLLATKTSAFQLAIDAAITVLRVDQIIMSKPAGAGKSR